MPSGDRGRLGRIRRFFFQAEDGIRDDLVTGVQTCALPILRPSRLMPIPGRKLRTCLKRPGAWNALTASHAWCGASGARPNGWPAGHVDFLADRKSVV